MIQRLAAILRRAARSVVRDLLTELRQAGAGHKMAGKDRLQLGAGPHPLPGWANLDLGGNNICWDLTRPLPIAPETVRLIYSEHFIEHVTREQAQAIFENCYTVLAPGGVLRISTPDLKKLVADYAEDNLVGMAHGNWFPKTTCRMVNEAVREWGHNFIYDEPELTGALREAGFQRIERVKRGESTHHELRNLETRPDFGDLIVEATKR